MKIIVFFITIYQKIISPILGPHCRFYPTCSEYTKEAIQQHGYRGLWLAVWRIVRCHPFSSGGYDPPPRR